MPTLAELQAKSIAAMNVKLRAQAAEDAKANARGCVSKLGGLAQPNPPGKEYRAKPMLMHTENIRRKVRLGRPSRG